MSIEMHQITVNDLPVDVVRKAIKNLHLGVYPPHGRVRVAAPLAISDDAVRLAVIGKFGWIKRQQAKFQTQPRESKREMVSGESHYFQGQRYRLRVIPHDGPAKVELTKSWIILYTRPDTTEDQRDRILQDWYRKQLKELIPPLLEKWQSIIGVQVADWGIKKMKTKWGTCNIEDRRIWLNLELAKKPLPCLEYIIVHELLHLHERCHNERFRALLERYIPQWRRYQAELRKAHLGHDCWNETSPGTQA